MPERAANSDQSKDGVHDLDQDARWQARLDEARARREIALKEKAKGNQPTKRRVKPWEKESKYAPNDAVVVVEENDASDPDKKDFSDRVNSIRKAIKKPRGHTGGPPQHDGFGLPDDGAVPEFEDSIPEIDEHTSGLPSHVKPLPFVDPVDVEMFAASLNPAPEDDAKKDVPESPKKKSVASRYLEALDPEFEPSKPYVPGANEPVDYAIRTPSYIVTRPLEQERKAREQEDTEAALSAARSIGAIPEIEPEPEVLKNSRGKGVPSLLLACVCVLAVMPFTHFNPRLEIGPRVDFGLPGFGLQPALGVMQPMNAFPRETVSREWTQVRNGTAQGLVPATLDVPSDMQRDIAVLVTVPSDEGEGGVSWTPMSAIERSTSPTFTTVIYDALPTLPGELPDRLLTGRAVEPAPSRPLREDAALRGFEAEADPLIVNSGDIRVEGVNQIPTIVVSPATRPSEGSSSNGGGEQTATNAEVTAPFYPDPTSVLNVTVLVPNSADRGAADQLAANVEARGHEVASVKQVGLKISSSNIRYFHVSDRSEAARLANAYDVQLGDFTSLRPRPERGTVEVWLAGEGRAATQVRPRPAEDVIEPQPVRPNVYIVRRPPSLVERLTTGFSGRAEENTVGQGSAPANDAFDDVGLDDGRQESSGDPSTGNAVDLSLGNG